MSSPTQTVTGFKGIASVIHEPSLARSGRSPRRFESSPADFPELILPSEYRPVRLFGWESTFSIASGSLARLRLPILEE
jgi:hypothetical protein